MNAPRPVGHSTSPRGIQQAARDYAHCSRRAQGLPVTVRDPGALARIALLLDAGLRTGRGPSPDRAA